MSWYVASSPSWEASTTSQLQLAPMPKDSGIKMGVPLQHSHGFKQLNVHFQEQDSCSTQSTGQSYNEVPNIGGSTEYNQATILEQTGHFPISSFSLPFLSDFSQFCWKLISRMRESKVWEVEF